MVKKLQLLILMCFLAILSWQCSKDQLNPEETKISGFKRVANSKERLASIRSTFNSRNIGASVQFKNKSSKTTWTPDWDQPMFNQVNDSTVYVFYPLIGNIIIDGKTSRISESEGKSFLIVKNEQEFYKGIYTPKVTEEIFQLSDFTGNLDLINLETNKGVVIDYINGYASENYIRKSSESSKLQKNGDMTTFGWETECEIIVRCTYRADCYQDVAITSSLDCAYPSTPLPWSCSQWVYVETHTWEKCKDVYVPDPPGGVGPGPGTNPPDPGVPETTPDIDPEGPCNLGKQLQNDATFKNLMNDLKSKTSSNREYAHVQTTSGSWSMYEGAQNGSGIDNLPGTGVKAIIHSHYNDPNMLSIFSTADIRALHQMAFGGGFGNTISDAYIGVVTPNLGGTAYLLSISDINKFAAKNDEIKGIIADNLYNALIKPSQSNTLNESGFLKIIEGWGLTLLKTDYNDISYWGTIKPDGAFGTKLTSCW